jgi:hypothetical protein
MTHSSKEYFLKSILVYFHSLAYAIESLLGDQRKKHPNSFIEDQQGCSCLCLFLSLAQAILKQKWIPLFSFYFYGVCVKALDAHFVILESLRTKIFEWHVKKPFIESLLPLPVGNRRCFSLSLSLPLSCYTKIYYTYPVILK